jgi:hypothetical protein
MTRMAYEGQIFIRAISEIRGPNGTAQKLGEGFRLRKAAKATRAASSPIIRSDGNYACCPVTS